MVLFPHCVLKCPSLCRGALRGPQGGWALGGVSQVTCVSPCSRSQSWSPVPAGQPPRIHPSVITHPAPRIHPSVLNHPSRNPGYTSSFNSRLRAILKKHWPLEYHSGNLSILPVSTHHPLFTATGQTSNWVRSVLSTQMWITTVSCFVSMSISCCCDTYSWCAPTGNPTILVWHFSGHLNWLADMGASKL